MLCSASGQWPPPGAASPLSKGFFLRTTEEEGSGCGGCSTRECVRSQTFAEVPKGLPLNSVTLKRLTSEFVNVSHPWAAGGWSRDAESLCRRSVSVLTLKSSPKSRHCCSDGGESGRKASTDSEPRGVGEVSGSGGVDGPFESWNPVWARLMCFIRLCDINIICWGCF